MRFIKKKNLLRGENLLYTPEIHWMYLVRPPLEALAASAFFLLLIVVCPRASADTAAAEMFRAAAIYAFLAAVLLITLRFLYAIFGYMNAEYGITDKRLLMKRGAFPMTTLEIAAWKIESIACTQGVLGRIFNYGTIRVTGTGRSLPVFYMVSRPFAVRRKIVEIAGHGNRK